LMLSCGKKEDTGSTAAADNSTAPAEQVSEEGITEPPPPTEPPTEKETEPPTEPPTDPAELPAPDVIGEFEIIPGARYYLWSPNSNLYLQVDGDFKYAGFTQEEYTGKPDQMFVFEKIREEVGDTKTTYIYRVRALGTKASYFDTEDGIGNEDGKSLLATTLDAPEGEGSQEFTLKAQKKGKVFEDINLPIFSINSVISKNSKCVDVSGVSVSPGGFIHMWGGGSANNQKWFFELVSDVESGKIIPRGLQDIPDA